LISSVQISNYKSFLDSEVIKFSSGFNIIVGQNNVGKTALIEALSFRISDKPHRSLSTASRPNFPRSGSSIVKIDFELPPEELSELFSTCAPFHIFGGPQDQPHHVFDRFVRSLENTRVLRCNFQNGQWIQSQFIDDAFNSGHAAEIAYDLTTSKFKLKNPDWRQIRNFEQYGVKIAQELVNRIYIFRAERLNLSQSNIDTNDLLQSDASNLPSALHLLQSNVSRFRRFNEDVRTVFPDIYQISTRPIANNKAQIDVWNVDPTTERQDLTVPLSECGTGIGQVLAILYVVLTAEYPRTILIDEPQSFLHPGAIRKLFDILKRHPQHQFIISTHSPTVVTAANPRTLLLLRKEGNETKTEVLKVSEASELRSFLSEIGARLSDVFGADNILWVEGRTEEIAFKIIVEELLKIELLGTEILGVKQVGDLEGRHAKTVLEIYQRLCVGKGLLPPALGFSFDREGRTEKERNELSRDSAGMIHFIPRRMFENFLLNPAAITTVLSQCDSNQEKPLVEKDVSDWIDENVNDKRYLSPSSTNWRSEVDAAKLLADVFNQLTESRVAFDKLKHGIALLKWIVQNSPGDLSELAQFIKEILQRRDKLISK